MTPSSKSYALPTYHVVPRFDIAAKGGPLELGTVVNSLQKLRPLNRGAIVPIPPSLSYEPVKHHGITEKWSHLRQGHGSVWARAFASQALGGGAEATAEDETQRSVKCDELVTLYFDPNDEYVARSLATRGVNEYFIGSGYKHDVYMITGLKVARNLHLDSVASKKRQINMDVAAREPNSGSGLGAEAGFETSDQHTVEFEVHDIVVGFRVRRYAYVPASRNFLSKKKKLEGDDYVVHAEMYEHQKEKLASDEISYHEVAIEEEQRVQEEASAGGEEFECWVG